MNVIKTSGKEIEKVTLVINIIKMKLTLTKLPNQKIALCFVLIFALSNMVQAQVIVQNDVDTLDERKLGKYALTAAYFGETITHPGFNLGVEYILWEKRKLKLISSANIGWYTHPRHHHALFLNLEGGFRATASYGLYTDLFVGIGYHHSWVNGDLYVANEADDVKVIWDAGRPHLMMTASLGLGWVFSKKSSSDIKAFVRLKPMFIYPVNHNMLIQGALMVGAIWPIPISIKK